MLIDAWTVVAGNAIALGLALAFIWWRLDKIETQIKDLWNKFGGVVKEFNDHRLDVKKHTPLSRVRDLEKRVNAKLNGV